MSRNPVSVAAEMAALHMKVLQTGAASVAVMGQRWPMIWQAAWSPQTANHAELHRMVVEKSTAFTASSLALWRSWWLLQWDLGATMGGSFRAQSARMLKSASAMTASGSAALRPIHATVTGNVRRLRRR